MLQTASSSASGTPVLNSGHLTYGRGPTGIVAATRGHDCFADRQQTRLVLVYSQHDNTVSVGVVPPFDYLFRRGSHEQTYTEEVEACPGVKQRVANARRATGYFATKDYSYRSKQVAGDGWVLIGDAFGFLDPLYSSGVLLALKSGELAADAIAEGLAKGDVSAAQLGKWGELFNRGIDRMRRLVCEYYDGFSFGQFVRNFPELKGLVTDLLIGDLFTDRVDAVWAPMESLYGPDKRKVPDWTDQAPPTSSATR